MLIPVLCLAMVFSSCKSEKRKEIEQRKAEMEERISQELEDAQKELEATREKLAKTDEEYATLEATVQEHRRNLNATAEELSALTRMRLKRDSLQARVEAFYAEIKAIKENNDVSTTGNQDNEDKD